MYDNRAKELGPAMQELERVALLRNVDIHWMNHIDAMDELKRGISLRSYAQRDPVVDYRLEGFEMFDEMISTIRADTVRMILTVRIKKEEGPKREQVAKPTISSHGEDGAAAAKTPVRKNAKVGRNDPCPCGSGKKYKNCCLLKEQQASGQQQEKK